VLGSIASKISLVFSGRLNARRRTGMPTFEPSLSPGVSIVIVSFNESTRLQATLSSIPYGFQNIEFILVVPASDHESIELAHSLSQSQVQVINDLGLGVYHAMNIGIKHSRFSHVLFLNTGDLITSAEVLNQCLIEIERHVNESLILPVAASWNVEIDSAAPNLSQFLIGKKHNYISHQGVLFSRFFVEDEGNFDERYKVAADFKQLCKLFKNGRYQHLGVKLVSIEFPKFSSRFNRRGRVETFLIILLDLRGKIRLKSLASRVTSEFYAALKKLS